MKEEPTVPDLTRQRREVVKTLRQVAALLEGGAEGCDAVTAALAAVERAFPFEPSAWARKRWRRLAASGAPEARRRLAVWVRLTAAEIEEVAVGEQGASPEGD